MLTCSTTAILMMILLGIHFNLATALTKTQTATLAPSVFVDPVDREAAEDSSTVTFTTGIATIAVTVLSGSAGGAAADVQLLGLLAAVPCASNNTRIASSGVLKMMFPFTLTEHPSGALQALLAISGGVIVLQGALAFFLQHRKQGKRREDQELSTTEEITARLASTRFPNFAFIVWSLCCQGIVLESLRQIHGAVTLPSTSEDDSYGTEATFPRAAPPVLIDKVVAGIGLFLFVLVLAGLIFWRTYFFPKAAFTKYTLSRLTHHKFTCLFIPLGYWGPTPFEQAHGSLVHNFVPGSTWLLLIEPLRAIIAATIVTFQSVHKHHCEAQFLGLGSFIFFHAGLVLVRGQTRVPIKQPLQIISLTLTGMALMSPAVPALRSSLPLLLSCTSALILLTAVLSLAASVYEYFKLRQLEEDLQIVYEKQQADSMKEAEAMREVEAEKKKTLLEPLLENSPPRARAMLVLAASLAEAVTEINRQQEDAVFERFVWERNPWCRLAVGLRQAPPRDPVNPLEGASQGQGQQRTHPWDENVPPQDTPGPVDPPLPTPAIGLIFKDPDLEKKMQAAFKKFEEEPVQVEVPPPAPLGEGLTALRPAAAVPITTVRMPMTAATVGRTLPGARPAV